MTAADCNFSDTGDLRNAILEYNEVKKLDNILNETLIICGDYGLPTISVTIKDFLLSVKHKLEDFQFPMVDIRLNGGAAAAVLDPHQLFNYNDIDVLINLDSSQVEDNEIRFNEAIKAVLDVIYDFLQPMPENINRLFKTQKLSYIQKLVKIQNPENGDSWSLLGLGGGHQFNYKSCRIDLKFTYRMKRQYEFSIDSFQIVLDSLLIFYEALCKFSPSNGYLNKNFYPTVSVISKWPSLTDAFNHLSQRYIITCEPENIRGGGLLKYCKLLVQKFIVPEKSKTAILERYMCSRFFIDYNDIQSQRKVILSYLKNHFQSPESQKFLENLKKVISQSSVCLMNNERQQTLFLIDQMIIEINSYFYLGSSSSFLFCQPDNIWLSDLEWSVDKIINGIISLDNMDLLKFKGKPISPSSSHWSTPTDMSPIDLPNYHQNLYN